MKPSCVLFAAMTKFGGQTKLWQYKAHGFNSKSEVLASLLKRCETWLHNIPMIPALPPGYRFLKAAHKDRVPSQFCHVTGTQLPYLSSYTVLLHQWFLEEEEEEEEEEREREIDLKCQLATLFFLFSSPW